MDAVGDVEVEGRLIGGCIETLCNLTGTAYLDTSAFARAEAPEGLLVQVEAAEDEASIIADVECGHVPPYLPIVNGARGRVVHTATRSALTQTLD